MPSPQTTSPKIDPRIPEPRPHDALVAELTRLRGLVRRVVASATEPCCPLCRGREAHVPGCPWTAMITEAQGDDPAPLSGQR
jgi:hypothetical protein